MTNMAGRATARQMTMATAWSIGAVSLGGRRVRAIVPSHDSITRATGPRIRIDVTENKVWGTAGSPASSLPKPAKATVAAAERAKITVVRLNKGALAKTGTISLTTPRAARTDAHMAG